MYVHFVLQTQYQFECVFDEEASQKAVFDRVALPLVEDVLFGKNGLTRNISFYISDLIYPFLRFFYHNATTLVLIVNLFMCKGWTKTKFL